MAQGRAAIGVAVAGLLWTQSLNAAAVDSEHLLYFSRQSSGMCALKAWDHRSDTTVVLTTVPVCPVSLLELWNVNAPGSIQHLTVLAISDTAVDRIVIDERANVVARDTIPFPPAWTPELVSSESFALGRLTDSGHLGAATMIGARGGQCNFAYHEYRDGRWTIDARPTTPCSFGDFGGPRFAFESIGLFNGAGPIISRGHFTVSRAVLRDGNQHLRGSAAAALVSHGTARQLSSNTFELGPEAKDDGDGLYYLVFDFAGQRATVFYWIESYDYTEVTGLYLQPAGAVYAREVTRTSAAYPSIVDRYLVSGSNVLDMVTGRDALKETALLPFWY